MESLPPTCTNYTIMCIVIDSGYQLTARSPWSTELSSTGPGAVAQMSEELKDASKELPKAMM